MSIVWQAENDEWCRRVLEHHWPNTYIFDDVRSIHSGQERKGGKSGLRERSIPNANGSQLGEQPSANGVDLLCGGFPCQDLSVAGKGKGLKGERSGLFFEFARIADEIKPQWLLVENVVGLLSATKGKDFAVVLSTLAEIGYGLSWRVVDARYFGVPQRRRRVFIVGHLGDNGERAALALGAGGEGNLEAGRCSWQEASSGTRKGIEEAGQVASTLQTTCHDWSRSDGFNMVMSVSENQRAEVRESEVSYQLTTGGGKPGQGYPAARVKEQVRRLTPIECERLMSWPDNWTAIDGEKTPMSRRYKACGNGVVSNVAEWIGRRIIAIDENPTVFVNQATN